MCGFVERNDLFELCKECVVSDDYIDIAHIFGSRVANALIKRLCANYDGGNCLLLDDGEPCVCVQSISYSLLCKYFRNAVLPAEPKLEAEILMSGAKTVCERCGVPIEKHSNRQKYCTECARIMYLKNKAKYQLNKRSGVDN